MGALRPPSLISTISTPISAQPETLIQKVAQGNAPGPAGHSRPAP